MAKQVGPLFITGTIDGIIFYKLDGQYLMRSKGSYKSGKKMRKDPRLKRTMQNADRFGGASKLVQYIYYRHLPRAVRRHGLFGELTGMVNTWLYQGKTKEEAEELLIAYCQTLVQQATCMETATASTQIIEAPTSTQPAHQSTPTAKQKPKQARYLSKWKVRRNGRLLIPKSANRLPSLQPAIPGNVRQLKE